MGIFDWVANTPPSWFIWFTGACGVFAMAVALMSLPTALQMFWGRPKIEVEFDAIDYQGDKVLRGGLYNRPVENKLLRRLGVRREAAEDVACSFTVYEAGSDKVVNPFTMPILRPQGQDDKKGLRISLPASIFPARFGVLITDTDRKIGVLAESNQELSVGRYYLELKNYGRGCNCPRKKGKVCHLF